MTHVGDQKIMYRRTNELLGEILEELKGIHKILTLSKNEKAVLKDFPDWLSLPDHLRKTVVALAKLEGSATADEISEITGRARAACIHAILIWSFPLSIMRGIGQK